MTRSQQHRNNFVFLPLLSEQDEDPHPLQELETFHPDPMLSSFTEPQDEDLLIYLNNPNNFPNIDFLQHEHGLPDLSLPGFYLLPPQPCGSISQ